MAAYHSDPTANAAIGSVDKELKMVYQLAFRLRERRKKGRLTTEELTRAYQQLPAFSIRFFESIFNAPDK